MLHFSNGDFLFQMEDSDPLAGIDKEHTDVLMYCTGGIRCDVYSTILRWVLGMKKEHHFSFSYMVIGL